MNFAWFWEQIAMHATLKCLARVIPYIEHRPTCPMVPTCRCGALGAYEAIRGIL